jgi:mRNA interferase MazF
MMPKPTEVIKRGEIYMVDWGKEAGVHPGLIIQNDMGNKYSANTIAAYITSTPARNYPVVVSFADHESGLEHGGTIDLAKIYTIPKRNLGTKKGHLSSLKMVDVDKAIMASLGIGG